MPNNGKGIESIPATLGSVEPIAHRLKAPPDGQSLYKMMTIENLLRSVLSAYLHFNRVDSYSDRGADPHDGQQLLKDQPVNAGVRFENSPNFSMANYYEQSRGRTYACCFSLESSDYIWKNYANDSGRGTVCVVFDFAKLRETLNRTIRHGELEYGGTRCKQIFSINHGIVEYVDWANYRAVAPSLPLPNPIEYAFLKDEKSFSKEKEFRVSLSALGIGQFVVGGNEMGFPTHLQMAFDFRAAIADGTISEILSARYSDAGFLRTELEKLKIFTN
jgi:hypothetical protein